MDGGPDPQHHHDDQGVGDERLQLQAVPEDGAVEQQRSRGQGARDRPEPAAGQPVGCQRQGDHHQRHRHPKGGLVAAEQRHRRLLVQEPAERGRRVHRAQLEAEAAGGDVVGAPLLIKPEWARQVTAQVADHQDTRDEQQAKRDRVGRKPRTFGTNTAHDRDHRATPDVPARAGAWHCSSNPPLLHHPQRVAPPNDVESLTPCSPCSFGLLPHRRSGAGAQPNGRLGVAVSVRWIPLVTAAYGTRVARPARTTPARKFSATRDRIGRPVGQDQVGGRRSLSELARTPASITRRGLLVEFRPPRAGPAPTHGVRGGRSCPAEFCARLSR